LKLFASLSLTLLCATLASGSLFAQEVGSIRGFVQDRDFEAPVADARILIAETGEEVRSGEDGNYVFPQLPPGTYTVVISKDGYTRQVMGQVLVSPGRLSEVDASLTGEFTDLEEFVVQEVKFSGASELGLLELRFESTQLLDSVGAELISKAGAGDAASALTLVSGATVEDGKFPVIRGLPDRYVNSQLNGLRLPTADAEKRAVALDQFPASAIESIQVSKTFTPDQQGDASGGAVNVVLKGVPEETTFKASSSYSYNTRTSDRDDFLTYEGGGIRDYFGFDDGSRDTSRQTPGTDWDGAAGATTTDAPTDYKYNFSGGSKYELGNEVKIGGFGSVFYERSAQHIENKIDDSYFIATPGGDPVPEWSQGSPQQGEFITSLFDVTESSQQVKSGGLGVIGLEMENHKLTLTGLYTHDAEDTVIVAEDTRGKEYFFPGYDPNDPAGEGNQRFQEAPYLRYETLRYRERETRNLQLAGEHTPIDPDIEIDGFLAALPPKLEWSVSEGTATFYEPDKRQLGALWSATRNNRVRPGRPITQTPESWGPLRPGENINLGNFNRTTRDIDERSRQNKADLTLPFTQWTDTEGFLKFGVFEDLTVRRYDQDSYSSRGTFVFYQAGFEDDYSEYFEDQIVPIQSEDIDVDYRGEQYITAWYWMADIPLTDWFSVNGGIRYENTELSIVNQPEGEVFWFPPGALAPVELRPGDSDVSIEQQDQLPAIGFAFTPHEDWTFRGSYSETIARQTFRELTPILQQEFLGSDVFIGNPQLQTASLKNYDLRLDYTPFTGSLLSASWFLKEIKNPIENVQRAANAFTYTTPVNYPEGQIKGWEFEARQQLGTLYDPLDGMQLGANATFIDSEVTVPEEEQALFRQFGIEEPRPTRDATNAPEYLYNIFAIYNLKKLGLEGTEVAAFYTVRGDTLVAGAGAADGRFIPDVYEKEYGTLNVSLSQKLAPGWDLKLQAKNILDPDIETVYRSDQFDGDITKTSYKKGIEYSVGLSASF
jgi:TonB-dependent receptor